MDIEAFQERLAWVRRRVQQACERAGREPGEVQLLPVTKTFGPEIIRSAAEAGLTVFGESKVQEARAKIPDCPGHLSWHLVGHLQSNKVHHAVLLFDMIHSVDSLKLLEALEREGDAAGRSLSVCLEVNVSGESAKFGVAPEQLPALLEAAARCTRIDVVGLMTIPPWGEDPEKARPYFRQLRDLRERCRTEYAFPMDELSMGMSHDFEVAIEEGATWIRLGTVLFGPRRSARGG